MSSLLLLLSLVGANLTRQPEYAAYKVKIFAGHVTAPNGSQGESWHHGSGVAIGEKLILTNYHVSPGNLSGFVYDGVNQKPIRVSCKGYNEDLDLAVLYIIDDITVKYVELAEKAPRSVTVFGFNGADDPNTLMKATGGVYAWQDSKFGTRNATQIAKIQVDHGNSGSGVYTDDGLLAGLVFAKTGEEAKYGPGDVAFTPVEFIREKFETWEIQCGPGGCSIGGGRNMGGGNPLRPAPIPDEEPPVAEAEPKPPKKSIPQSEPEKPILVDACKCDPAKLKEVELLAQNARNEAEFARKELENQGKRLDEMDKSIKEGILATQNQTILLQRIDERVSGMEKKLSGRMKVQFSYDPKTNTLTPVK